MISRFFIDHPIFASVLSIVITLSGAIAVFTLPITQYPEITPPTVEVSSFYAGAHSQTHTRLFQKPDKLLVLAKQGPWSLFGCLHRIDQRMAEIGIMGQGRAGDGPLEIGEMKAACQSTAKP